MERVPYIGRAHAEHGTPDSDRIGMPASQPGAPGDDTDAETGSISPAEGLSKAPLLSGETSNWIALPDNALETIYGFLIGAADNAAPPVPDLKGLRCFRNTTQVSRTVDIEDRRLPHVPNFVGTLILDCARSPVAQRPAPGVRTLVILMPFVSAWQFPPGYMSAFQGVRRLAVASHRGFYYGDARVCRVPPEFPEQLRELSLQGYTSAAFLRAPACDQLESLALWPEPVAINDTLENLPPALGRLRGLRRLMLPTIRPTTEVWDAVCRLAGLGELCLKWVPADLGGLPAALRGLTVLKYASGGPLPAGVTCLDLRPLRGASHAETMLQRVCSLSRLTSVAFGEIEGTEAFYSRVRAISGLPALKRVGIPMPRLYGPQPEWLEFLGELDLEELSLHGLDDYSAKNLPERMTVGRLVIGSEADGRRTPSYNIGRVLGRFDRGSLKALLVRDRFDDGILPGLVTALVTMLPPPGHPVGGEGWLRGDFVLTLPASCVEADTMGVLRCLLGAVEVVIVYGDSDLRADDSVGRARTFARDYLKGLVRFERHDTLYGGLGF